MPGIIPDGFYLVDDTERPQTEFQNAVIAAEDRSFYENSGFDPVGIVGLDQDDTNTKAYPAGYKRNALGPVRLATVPGRGWMFGSGMLSMSAPDLAKWNIARLNRAVFPPDDWAEQERPVLRVDGTSNGYGLGVTSAVTRERRDGRRVEHGEQHPETTPLEVAPETSPQNTNSLTETEMMQIRPTPDRAQSPTGEGGTTVPPAVSATATTRSLNDSVGWLTVSFLM